MQQTLLVLRMYAAKLLVFLNVLGETFLSKHDIQTSCKQTKDTGLCHQFFPHNAPRRPTITFWKLKASYFVVLSHRRSPALPTQHCSSHLSPPAPLTPHWKHTHAACCSRCPTGHRESWTPQFLGSVPQVRVPFTSFSKQHNHNVQATQRQGRCTSTSPGAAPAQKAQCTRQHTKLCLTLFRTLHSPTMKTLGHCSNIPCRPISYDHF